MIIDPTNQNNNNGFNPNVDNSVKKASASGGNKFWFWFFSVLAFLTVIGVFFWVKWYFGVKNNFNNLQNRINQASSTIDVSMKKRCDTLTKLFAAAQGYMKHEKSIMENITKLRSLKIEGEESRNEAQKVLDNAQRAFNISVENYPDLKANSVVLDLMTSAEYIEDEIAASRRLYNSSVTEFNSLLFTYPTNIIAVKMFLQTLPLFVASENDKKDVDFSNLSQ